MVDYHTKKKKYHPWHRCIASILYDVKWTNIDYCTKNNVACVNSGVQQVLLIWVTRRVLYKRQELLTLREHMGSPPVFRVVRVAHLFCFLCCVVLFFVFVCLRSVPVSLDCLFLIIPSVFSNIYLPVFVYLKPTINIVESGNIETPNTQIHYNSLSWPGTGTSIKRGEVKLVGLPKSSLFVKWCGYSMCE